MRRIRRRSKRALPRLPATAATEAVGTFRLAQGFRIELVASEPHVWSPVDMAFDEDGRLWVVEMVDYPYDERDGVPPEGRIRVLEDDDGDGRFGRSSVFADRLRWPTGLCLWDGGVFVASAPDILYLKDTDGDHKADRKEVAFTGFRRDNVQALLSNLRWGLDNWFTGSSGQDGGRVRSLRKPDQAEVAVEGRHFRFRPTGEIEALSGDGRFSNTSDDFGRRFCSATTSPVRHVVVEDRYLRRNPHLPVAAVVHAAAAEGSSGPVYPASAPEPWRVLGTAYFMSARAESVIGSIERGGAVTGFFTGATGPLIYRGTALGEACYGQYFVGECGMNLVHRRTLTPAGCTFRADRVEPESEFLASTDNWFRPVSLANGPDGALYICDMYRETIEHPWSIPPSHQAPPRPEERAGARSDLAGDGRGRAAVSEAAPGGRRHRGAGRGAAAPRRLVAGDGGAAALPAAGQVRGRSPGTARRGRGATRHAHRGALGARGPGGPASGGGGGGAEGCLVGRPRAGGPPGAASRRFSTSTTRTRASGWSWPTGWGRPTTRGRPTSWRAWPEGQTCGSGTRSSARQVGGPWSSCVVWRTTRSPPCSP